MGFKSSLFEKQITFKVLKVWEIPMFLTRSKCSLRRSSPPSPLPPPVDRDLSLRPTGLTVARLVQKRKSFHDIYLPFLSCTPLFELSVLMQAHTKHSGRYYQTKEYIFLHAFAICASPTIPLLLRKQVVLWEICKWQMRQVAMSSRNRYFSKFL